MKKAQIDKISAIIIALVVLVLIFLLINNVKKEFESKSRLAICRSTVEANSQTWFKTKPVVRCPTEYLKIDLIDDSEIKLLLANKMKEGFDIFKPPEGATKWSLFDHDSVFCYVNTVVDFDGRKQPINGFLDYLFKEKVPTTDVSYMQYFQLKSGFADEILIKLDQNKLMQDSIDPSKRYAVVIVYARGKDWVKDFMVRADKVKSQIRAAGGYAFLGKVGFAAVTMGGDLETFAGTTAGVGGYLYGDDPMYNYIFGEGVPTEYSLMVFLKEYKKDSFEELGCKELPVKQS